MNSTETTSKEETGSIQAKKLCEHIKLTRKSVNKEQNKAQEGKLCRGRPARTEQASDKQGVLALQGNRCQISTRVSPAPETSTVRFAKQHQCDKHTTALKKGTDSSNDHIVPKADEILVELHKILVFRDQDPFINAVCTKRRLRPKGVDRKFSREQRRTDVKNPYFRKSSRTVGERALDEGKAANSSKQGCTKSNENTKSSETSSEIDNEISTRASQAEGIETKSVEVFNKECPHESGTKDGGNFAKFSFKN